MSCETNEFMKLKAIEYMIFRLQTMDEVNAVKQYLKEQEERLKGDNKIAGNSDRQRAVSEA